VVVETKSKKVKKFISVGIPGFDNLLRDGIPQGSSILVTGGPGSGKTNFCLQILHHQASLGHKCYYMGFGESEDRITENMKNFGWNPEKYIDDGSLVIKRFLTSEIYYYDQKSGDIQAMMTKEVDPLLMELEPMAIGNAEDRPDFIVIDSLSAISSTFRGKEQSARFYIERLFRFFERIGSTTLLISETQHLPEILSPPNAEEYLADGVVVFYNLRIENKRQRAMEILKIRGEKHLERIVPLQITDEGIVIHPDKEPFSNDDIEK
jgi:KaiC/GvpD/RAD55 family RecA-like ATPase